jgi:RNA polymerase sigma-70 factor (sigma-E family)
MSEARDAEGTEGTAGGIQKVVLEAAAVPGVELMADDGGTTALYRAHVPAAVRLAYLLTGDAASAQDVAHDAFLKAAGRVRTLRDPERFAGYLRRTVVRTVLMHRRSAERSRARAERDVRLGGVVDGDPSTSTAARLDVVAALATLPPRQQAALVLRYWLDLPEAEIARVIGCRPGTVKSTLSRGLDALREVVTIDV